MGSGEVAGAIIDSGPLIHLYEAGCLQLLGMFSPASAPEEVWCEVASLGRPPEADLLGIGLVREPHPADLAAFIEGESLKRLDRGEQECLWLCRHRGGAILLTDDLAAREAAKRLAIRPVGSLGVIVRAHRAGRIAMNEAERLLRRLQETTTLFVTPAIVDLAIEQLRARGE